MVCIYCDIAHCSFNILKVRKRVWILASLFEIKVDKLNGVGEKTASLLNKLGIMSVGDVIRNYPRTYQDHSKITYISNAEYNELVCIKATVESKVIDTRIRNGKLISKVKVYDDTSSLNITFFNNKYIKDMLKQGEEYIFYGKISSMTLLSKEMLSPEFSKADTADKIKPIYSATNGLSSRQIEKIVKTAFTMLPQNIKEPIPEYILDEFDICDLKYALKNIHFPEDEEALAKAKYRLVFEELLVLSLGLRLLKSHKREEKSIAIENDFTKDFFALLPFTPTNAQLKVTNECMQDILNSPSPMNRLVQGDVGSGKTAVATALCYCIAQNKYQSAFMAPTEILATQHYNNIQETLKYSGLRIELLVGSQTAKTKRIIKEKLINGDIDIVIGTHALLTDSVLFNNLALVVTDEQHRFGVSQRAKLLSKGQNPHLLVMSATPIPRTLGLIMYGDLDVSIIDELPKGRKRVDTLLIDSGKRERMYNFIKDKIDEGRQAYIVCPAVEENEFNLEEVEKYSEKLKETSFKNYKVEYLHGKMKSKDKDVIMQKFISGEIDLLVSTTVIEVGVDVPNAVIMVIENAERFGLSQLHQLRGRVGRGEYKSYCVLVSNSKGEDTIQRLKTMCSTNNGFKIAEVDLKLRGPGDFFGSKQHGLPELKIADISNVEFLQLAQQASDEIIKKSPTLTDEGYRGLNAEIKRLFGRIGDNALN